MFIVTGGAGFIGSNIVRSLNERGITDILVVDNLGNTDKIKNLADLRIVDYMDKTDFYDFMKSGNTIGKVDIVFHEGACSDTMATDGRYVLHNNFTFSKKLLEFCQRHNASFIYASSASVYGSGTTFIESPENESALNAYAWSKLLFDCYIRNLDSISVQCCGLRYFNVYGPREQHKGRMASVAWHFRKQLQDSGSVKLFCGSDGYGDGQQLRDFVYVDDVVNVNMFLMDNPEISGIFNVGTGRCQSFNDVALASINYVQRKSGKASITLDDAVCSGKISYIPMPVALEGKYQSYTRADLSNLEQVGYDREFDTVGQGVEKYMTKLDRND